MIKDIVKDPLFLSQKSKNATVMDAQVITDILDTFIAHREECIGMAANMIGYQKNIIIFDFFDSPRIMLNPVILEKSEKYYAEEGCLSLSGVKRAERYNIIKVNYMDSYFKEKTEVFKGLTAQIIQHEIDHCNGILI